jgi:SAM-dependent methyltransferase
LNTEQFQKHADRYDEWFDQYPMVWGSELAALKSLLPGFCHGVEVGVGTGRFAAPIGVAFGVEPSEAMARLAQGRGLQVVRGVGEALPVLSKTFDLVTMVTTVCFLDDVHKSFREIRRVLAPGGHLLIGFLDQDSEVGEQYLKCVQNGTFFKGARFVSTGEVLSGLVSLGLRRIRTVQTLFRPPEVTRVLSPVREGHGEGLFVVARAKSRSSHKWNPRLYSLDILKRHSRLCPSAHATLIKKGLNAAWWWILRLRTPYWVLRLDGRYWCCIGSITRIVRDSGRALLTLGSRPAHLH